MTNGKLPLIGLAAATLALSACVVKVWQATYDAEGSSTDGIDMTLSSEGDPIMLGETTATDTSPRKAFVARYDSAGNQTWGFTLDNGSLVKFGNNLIATDWHDDVLFSAYIADAEPSQNHRLVKLSSDGDLLWNVPMENSFFLTLDIKPVADTLYAVVNGIGSSYQVNAFSPEGEFLWTFTTCGTEECESGGASTDSSMPAPVIGVRELAVLDQGDLYLSTGTEIIQLDMSGNEINSVSAASLGVSGFADIADNGDHLVTAAANGTTIEVFVLNRDLGVFRQHTVNATPGAMISVAMNNETLICVASGDNDFLSVNGLGGLDWNRTFNEQLRSRELSNVYLSERGDCHVSTYGREDVDTDQQEPPVTTRTRIFNPSGKTADQFSIRHFAGRSVTVSDAIIYSVGLSSEYADGRYLPPGKATLFKHQRR